MCLCHIILCNLGIIITVCFYKEYIISIRPGSCYTCGELPCRVSSAYSQLYSNTFLGALTTTDLQPQAYERLDGITFTVEGKQSAFVHLTCTSDPLAERIAISCCAPSKYNYSFSCAECNVKLQGRNEFIDYQSLLVIYLLPFIYLQPLHHLLI